MLFLASVRIPKEAVHPPLLREAVWICSSDITSWPTWKTQSLAQVLHGLFHWPQQAVVIYTLYGAGCVLLDGLLDGN